MGADLQVVQRQSQAKADGQARQAATSAQQKRKLTIWELLKPHSGALALGALAVIGESAANLLQPWPLKIVLDNVLQSKENHGWRMRAVYALAGSDKAHPGNPHHRRPDS